MASATPQNKVSLRSKPCSKNQEVVFARAFAVQEEKKVLKCVRMHVPMGADNILELALPDEGLSGQNICTYYGGMFGAASLFPILQS